MRLETFELERVQSLWENVVDHNLTESGVHPYKLKELLNTEQLENVLSLSLGYGETIGDQTLRQAIASLYPGAEASNILVTNGSAESNFLAMWSLLEPDDEIVLMLPNYMQIYGITNSIGASVKPFYLREENDWAPDLDELESQLSSKTKVVAICNPNNPTGSVLSELDISRIISMTSKVGATLYSDEIYRGAELCEQETPSLYGHYANTVAASGLSKSYALPGLRIGWLVGPEKFISNACRYRDYTTISSGIISQYVAGISLQTDLRKEIRERSRTILNANLTTLTDWVSEHRDILNMVAPKAGGMGLIKYRLKINSTDLMNSLREKKGVFVAAGDLFGIDHFIRVGIGVEKETLDTGLEKISDFLMEIR